jgi:hypothetical protein
VTEPLYATDPDHPPPAGRPGEPGRDHGRDRDRQRDHDRPRDRDLAGDHGNHGRDGGRGRYGEWQPAPAPGRAGQPEAGHYPWSMEAQRAAARSHHGGFLRLIYSGLRAILLLPVRPANVNPGAGSCMALVALVTLFGIAGEWWLVAEPGDRFNWQALRSAWFDLPIILLGGAWLAQPRGPGFFARNRVPIISANPTPLLHFAAVMLSASAWIVAIAYGLFIAISAGLLPDPAAAAIGNWLYLAAPLWSYLVAVRTIFTMHRSAPIAVVRRFTVLVLLAAATAWSMVDPPESYWVEPPEQGPVNYVASEEILELQQSLLAEHLEGLLPHRPAVADLYFIGFAPYASEDVFKKELEVIQPLMDRRFDTVGRSLRLVNNAGTLRDYPLATVSNLRRALAAVARRMDPQEDVLVLYVTTHGSRNAVLAADLPPLRLHNLDAPTLKRLLDDAGIRHRVLIISACYSGGLIPDLRSPDTLIMTAASADRPSFGCGSESDFTYFGDAVFNAALTRTHSFEQGFALALPAVQAREAAEGFEPSLPQIAVGAAIRERLAAVEKRLAATR